ncbi:MAG: GGDEF domain-containing protein [Oleiphilaceae bacterium]|jgi:GGDEF domain-containing protein
MIQHLSFWFFLSLTLLVPSSGQANSEHDFKFWQIIKTNDLSLNEIINTPEEKWQALDKGVTKSYFLDKEYWQASKGSTMWIKISIPRRINSHRIWFELVPNVGLDGQLAILENGHWRWTMPIGKRNNSNDTLSATFLTFLIDNPRDHKTAYLKLQTSQVFHFNIQVKTDDEQISSFLKDHLFNGFILGFLLLAVIYNLAIGLSANEKLYLYYAFYVFCTSLYITVICGYPRLLFPEWGGDAIFSNLTGLLSVFSATVFIRDLLDTSNSTPRTDIILRILQAFSFISFILIGIISDSSAYILVESLGIITPIILFLTGIFAYRNKHPHAIYFLIAWSILIFSISAWAWMWLGIIEANLNILRLLLLGCLFEVIILSFVLGYRYSHLKKQTELLTDAKLRYQILSETDYLTGVYNRRGFIKQVEHLISSDRKECIWLSIDIDHFKNFNDMYGHIAGDKLLTEFGNMLSVKVRREDLAAKLIAPDSKSTYRRGVAGRLGGEEFAIFLINCSLPHARLYGERLLRDFQNLTIKHSDDTQVGTTISIGASILKPHELLETAWKRADKLLYKAKDQGRNRVIQETETN